VHISNLDLKLPHEPNTFLTALELVSGVELRAGVKWSSPKHTLKIIDM
jgi:hypothetical protein